MLFFSFLTYYLLQAFAAAPLHHTAPRQPAPIADTTAPYEAAIPGDFADPSVVRVGNTYYATGTSSEWAPYFPLYKSNDRTNWQQTGYAFTEKPGWALSSFWAPELYYHNATYYLYYVAKRKSDGVSCIGVATAQHPEKGFTDAGIVLGPGQEVIDPFIVNDNGVLYLTYKAYGLEKRPIELQAVRLSADGLKVEGQPFTLLRDDNRAQMEGQCIVQRNGFFYLLYSVGGCCGKACSYAVKVARSASFKGPYTILETPVLTEDATWKCPGHGTVVKDENGTDFYLYHAYNKKDDVYTGRQGMLAQLVWDENKGWPRFVTAGGAKKDRAFEDGFDAPQLAHAWQWDLQYGRPNIKLQNSSLAFSGRQDSTNKTGTVLTVRPEKGDYTITASVANFNASLKGIVLYGDKNNAVGLGIKNNLLQLWEVKKGVRTIVKTRTASNKKNWLRLTVEAGYKCRFFSSADGTTWTEIRGDARYYNAAHLPPWDRSARPGLLHLGAANTPAVFPEFAIAYNH